MPSASAGQWITIHGHHILIKGAVLSPEHISDIAAQTGLSPAATQALKNAHSAGQIHTDHQLHNAATEIAGKVAVGFDETHAISEALSQFGKHGPASTAPASGKTAVTPIWQGGKGKATKTKAGTSGGHVDVVTHGAPVLPGEVADYAAKFGLPKATADQIANVASFGGVKNDTHLAQLVGDTIHVVKMTGQPHKDAVVGLLGGKSATQIIAEHQTVFGASGVSMPTPMATSSPVDSKIPIASVGPKSKADFAAIPDVHLSGEAPPPPLKPGQTQSAGILLVEPDGKVWVYEPKNHFAGYEHTFSKGGVESGLSLQQSAHKELYEELGLTATITGVVGDFETAGTQTRYYIGVRTGGDPKDAESGLTQPGASETHAVKLVTPDEAAKLLNKKRDQDVLASLQAHLAAGGNPHDTAAAPAATAPAATAPAATSPVAPAVAPPVAATPHNLVSKSGVTDFLAENGVSGGLSDNAWTAMTDEIVDGKVKKADLPAILGVAATMAKDEGKGSVDTGHIKKAVWMHKKGVIDPNYNAGSPPTVAAPVAPVQVAAAVAATAPASAPAPVIVPTPPAAPVPSGPHHVTIQGKKFDIDPVKPVTVADVDALKAQVKVSSNGETALKAAITGNTIKTHGAFMEKAALAQAASLAAGHTSVNGTGFKATSAHPGIESLLDAAHNGDAGAKTIAAKLGAHSFTSPAAQKSALDAAQKAALDAEFAGGTLADHTHDKIGGKGGFNDGALYAMPGGAKNYVKNAPSAAVAHNEHLANQIYQALGLSAPNSKVMTDASGATKYASHIIENKGDLKSVGITPEVSRELLKGFAADVLLGNRDVLGNGDKPLSNVVIGHDGKTHRIDNGGSLLFTGVGKAKKAPDKTELREWDGFSTAATNGNYASVFAAAGVKNAESIAGIGQQIKAITALRDSRGGWEGFIKHAAPDMPLAQRRETAQMLEARTALLQAKVKAVAGGNSLVGVRNFHYSGSGHEHTLIAHHKANAPKLSPEEVSAVDAFKGGSYSAWNSHLLGTGDLTPTQEKRTKLLDAMYQKPGMTLGHDTALSRKLSIHDSAELQKLAALAPGAIIAHTPVFQSTSVDSSVWSGNVQLCILAPKECPAVTPKAYTSTNAGEKEVLLPRGISYRVVSVAGPGAPAPDHTPPGWTWTGSTRLVVEAIVPGVNDMEHDGVGTHILTGTDLNKRAATILQNHAKVPLPNLSALPHSTLPQWAPVSTAPAAVPKKKSKAKPSPSAAAYSGGAFV